MELGAVWSSAYLYHGVIFPTNTQMVPRNPDLHPLPATVQWGTPPFPAIGEALTISRSPWHPPLIAVCLQAYSTAGITDPIDAYASLFATLPSLTRWILVTPTDAPLTQEPSWWDAWCALVEGAVARQNLRFQWITRQRVPWAQPDPSLGWNRPWEATVVLTDDVPKRRGKNP